MLTMAELRQHAYESTVKKGRSYYYDGNIEDIEIDAPEPGDRGNTRIYAKVRGSSRTPYKSYLILNADGKILDYDCTCPAASGYWGMCKHCVAAALEYQERESRAHMRIQSSDITETSLALRSVLNQYALQNRSSGTEPRNEIELDCYFTRSERGLMLECKVGGKKKYVVKNLIKFVRDVEQMNHVTYGTYLEFIHRLPAFTLEAQEIYRLIRKAVQNKFPNYQNNFYLTGSQYRSILLEHDDLEQFLNHFLGSTIDLDGHKTYVADENPELKLLLQSRPGGARLSGEVMDIYKGSSCIFIYKDFTFWRCTEDFALSVLPILEAVSIPDYDGKKYRPLYLSEGDYTAFCRDLLPRIEPYVAFDSGEIDLTPYAPIDPEFMVYLRMSNEYTIEATALVRYASTEFDLLYKPEYFADVRNQEKENTVIELLKEYFSPAMSGGEKLTEALDMFPVILDQNGNESYDEGDEAKIQETAEATFTGGNTRWEAAGDDAVYEVLTSGLKAISEKARLYVDAAIRRLTVGIPAQVNIGVSYSGDLLNLDISVAGMDMDEVADVLSSYRLKKKYYRLKTGDFLDLENSGLDTLSDLTDGLQLTERQLTSGQALVPSYRALYVDNVLQESEDAEIRKNQEFRTLVENVRDYSAGDFPIPEGLNAKLRKYQREGYQWLCSLYDAGFGGILADDMGLGKTLQVITMFLRQKQLQENFSALVVCPASLVYNWESEVMRFAPELTVQIISGDSKERHVRLAATKHCNVNITSYDLLKRYIDDYEEVSFDCCILDEAQYIKNSTTQVAKACKTVKAYHRFALTGTPIENRLSDLWSIFEFLMPGYLYSYSKFKTELETPIIKNADETATQRLTKMISPFLLRRRKGDVLKDLPEKLEESLLIRMKPEQQKLYTAHVSRLRNDLQNKNDNQIRESQIQILAEITRLRQLCCSPALCYEDYNGGSGKVDAVMEVLMNAVDSGHKVLVFSQFTSMLEILIKKWSDSGLGYLYLSGKDSKLHRKEMVEEFQSGNIPVFFISLKAGGTGLNLTAADTVIHCDPWWNVAAQNQATDRAHRIGQTNVVNVLKLVAKDTIEERIINLQNKKASLSDSVIEGDAAGDFRLNKETLMELFS